MNLRRSLALLWHDLAALFPERDSRFWFLMAAAVLLQAGFWYLATPGPALFALEPRLPLFAFKGVVATTVLLLVLPFAFTSSVGVRLEGASFGSGDARFGLPLVATLWLLAIVPLFAATGVSAFQNTNPWPGVWAGASLANLAIWLAVSVLYYLAFEFFYRGFLLGIAADRFGITAGIWLQALAATLIHVGKPLPLLVLALPASLLLGVFAVRSRSLLYPLLLHWLIGATTDVFTLYHAGALLS